MPLNIDYIQILLHLLNFVILAGGLTIILFNPVKKFLDQRKAHYADIEKKNAEIANENEKLRLEYEQKLNDADAEISERKTAMQKEISESSAQIIQDAKDKANAIVARAEQEAEERKAHILESAQTEIGELVVGATQKLLSNTVTPERNGALYDEFIRLANDAVSDERSNNDKK